MRDSDAGSRFRCGIPVPVRDPGSGERSRLRSGIPVPVRDPGSGAAADPWAGPGAAPPGAAWPWRRRRPAGPWRVGIQASTGAVSVSGLGVSGWDVCAEILPCPRRDPAALGPPRAPARRPLRPVHRARTGPGPGPGPGPALRPAAARREPAPGRDPLGAQQVRLRGFSLVRKTFKRGFSFSLYILYREELPSIYLIYMYLICIFICIPYMF